MNLESFSGKLFLVVVGVYGLLRVAAFLLDLCTTGSRGAAWANALRRAMGGGKLFDECDRLRRSRNDQQDRFRNNRRVHPPTASLGHRTHQTATTGSMPRLVVPFS